MMIPENQTLDCKDMAESLKCDIDITADFLQIIMGQYENLNPNEHRLRAIYLDTQTYCNVLFDRLCELQHNIKLLVDMLYKK